MQKCLHFSFILNEYQKSKQKVKRYQLEMQEKMCHSIKDKYTNSSIKKAKETI